MGSPGRPGVDLDSALLVLSPRPHRILIWHEPSDLGRQQEQEARADGGPWRSVSRQSQGARSVLGTPWVRQQP